MRRATKRRIERFLRHLSGVLYTAVGIIATILATFADSLSAKALILLGALVVGATGYYFDTVRGARKRTKEQLRPPIEEIILPMMISKYKELHGGDPPEIRVNIMLLEHRDFPIPAGERKLLPWKRSLQIDFSYGDYDSEHHIKWGVDEGVCGTVIEYNTAIDSDLNDVEIHEWDMTEKQLRETEHLGSVLSIPIYRQDDEKKKNPIGVVNFDSEANLDETRFSDSELKERLKRYASYVGRML